MSHSVYIVRAVGTGMIKVGITAEVDRRLAEIRALCPVPVEIVDVLEGATFDVERTIHGLMSKHRSHGEWFFEAGALPIALRWFSLNRDAACEIAAFIAGVVPPERTGKIVELLKLAGAKNIASELVNHVGSASVMDRRYA